MWGLGSGWTAVGDRILVPCRKPGCNALYHIDCLRAQPMPEGKSLCYFLRGAAPNLPLSKRSGWWLMALVCVCVVVQRQRGSGPPSSNLTAPRVPRWPLKFFGRRGEGAGGAALKRSTPPPYNTVFV
jgi:hypothetical protein